MQSPTVARATRLATAMLLYCAVLSACSNDIVPSGGSDAEARRLRDSLVISGPLAPGYSMVRPARLRPRLSATRIAADSIDNQVAYVSLPPASFTGGDSVRLVASGYPEVTPIIRGGFDPVAVYAGVGDSISVEVFTGSAHVGPVLMIVPSLRAPTVVRTAPPKGARDVPMNQQIVIVFSQPIDSATITTSSVRLLLNGQPVAATRSVLPIQPWVVRLTPSALLAPSATYTIAIDGTIKDATGLPIAAPVSTDFITGTSADSVASVAVYALGRGWGGGQLPSPVAVAAPGGSVQYAAYEVSLAGDTLTPASSAPITWASSDHSVATVDGAGLVTAVASGGATLNACTGAICGQGQIVVDTIPIGVKAIPLGDLGGGASRVFDMAGGYVTGFSNMPVDGSGRRCQHAILWSQSRGMEDIGPAGQCGSDGYFVNSKGVVIGGGDSGYFIWRRATGALPLADPDAVNGPWVVAGINDNGEVAWCNGAGTFIAFSSPTTGMHIHATPAESTTFYGMNDLGQVVAQSTTSTSALWILDGATGQVLTTINSTGTIGAGQINNNGVVTGVADWDVDPTPFRWSAAQGFSYLPPLGPGANAGPMYINSAGDVTVYFTSYRHIGADSLFEGSSAVWMADGSLVFLGGLGGTRTFANGINDNHQAAGHAEVGSSTGPQEAVIWDLPSGAVAQRTRASAVIGKGQPVVSQRASPRSLARRVTPPRGHTVEY